MEKSIIFALICSFVLSCALEKGLIPILKRLKMGQRILEIGPSWHISKQGTPTMGGLAFIIAATVIAAAFGVFGDDALPIFITLLYTLSNGLIGIVDDLIKLKRKQNEGLSASGKFLLQLIAAAVYVVVLSVTNIISTELYVPFINYRIDIGRLYYPFALLVLTGFSNAVNLTDGLDGLCSSVSCVVLLYFCALFISVGDYNGTVLSLSLLGGVIGFLIYNFHPAKVFMGDTGSLYLGSFISALTLISYKNTAIFIVGAIYLVEAASVMIQVLYYKLTKKRFFLMAPYHHHLEKKGMGEVSITLMFTAITFALAAVSYIFV